MTQDNAVIAHAGALEPNLWASPVSQLLCSLGWWLNLWALGTSPPWGQWIFCLLKHSDGSLGFRKLSASEPPGGVH